MTDSSTPEGPRLVVVFCQYDTARYPNAFQRLREVLGPVRPHLYIRVDNRHEGASPRQVTPDILELGGDNSLHEFSGWSVGLDAYRDRREEADLYLFVTDAFEAYGDDYSELLDPPTLRFLLTEQAASGLVNRPGRRHPEMIVLGRSLDFWVRTSFLLLPAGVLKSLGTLVTVEDIDRFCPKRYDGRAFSDEAPLNTNYRDYIETWLTRRWHSAFALSETTWDRFREKTRSILNEHALTGRIRAMGTPIYDLRFLRQRRLETSAGPDREDPCLVDLREDPLGQFAYFRRATGEPSWRFGPRRNR